MNKLYDETGYSFSDTAYWSNDTTREYGSFAEYLEEFADADNGMNYVVNWAWTADHEQDDGSPVWHDDMNYRDGKLHLLMIGQRKGTYFTHHIQVCRTDEPVIRKYLQDKFNYIKNAWLPVSEDVSAPKSSKRRKP